MDFNKYKIVLNAKSLCLFEHMTGKSFFKLEQEDLLKLMYCIVVVNNPELCMTYPVFEILCQDKKVMKWLVRRYEEIMEFEAQFKLKEETPQADNAENKEDDEEEVEYSIAAMAGTLIVEYGLDPDYVMYRMGIWELNNLFKAAETKKRNELTEQRLWTFLQISPHIDLKKIKTPEKLLPFPWEKGMAKKRAENDLKKKATQISKVIGMKLNI